MWIFGYGSLIWRPGFDYVERVPGRVYGFVRRFYQGSTDHRGTEAHPGRVVTLLENADEEVAGVAYRIEGHVRDEVIAKLDHREQGGYERHRVRLAPFDPSRAPIDDVVVYVAAPGNRHWLGPAPIEEIAQVAHAAAGPSGENRVYVLELAAALRDMGAHDAHVFDIEAALLSLDGR